MEPSPAGFVPTYSIKKNQDIEIRQLSADDTFFKSIQRFVACMENASVRIEEYNLLKKQEELVEEFKYLCK